MLAQGSDVGWSAPAADGPCSMALKRDLHHALVDAQSDPRVYVDSIEAAHKKEVKRMMASIALLQKQKAQLLEEAREHKRTRSFQRQEEELGKQQELIDTFKNLWQADPTTPGGKLGKYTTERYKEIASLVNSAGPKRVVVKSRTELRMDVELLQLQLQGALGERVE